MNEFKKWVDDTSDWVVPLFAIVFFPTVALVMLALVVTAIVLGLVELFT